MTTMDRLKRNFSNNNLKGKTEKLEQHLSSLQKVVLAYSGGVDSTLLLKLGREILGNRIIAVTACAEIFSQEETDAAQQLADAVGVSHQTISFRPLHNEHFVANSPDRCYYCKHDLCACITQVAKEEGAFVLIDGTNADDLQDYRPGYKAASQWGVRSPLLEAGFTKKDIRLLSRALHLPTWDKPSKACLASRFAYGQEITIEKLKKVEEAEKIISALGPKQIRVRLHDQSTARIEVEQEDIEQIMESEARALIISELQKLGFIYITVDLKGYTTGSVNELIQEER